MDSLENSLFCANLSRWPNTTKPFLKGNARRLFASYNDEKVYAMLPYDPDGDVTFENPFANNLHDNFNDFHIHANKTQHDQSVTFYHAIYVLGNRRLHSFVEFLAALAIAPSMFLNGHTTFLDGTSLIEPDDLLRRLCSDFNLNIIPKNWTDDFFSQVIISDYAPIVHWMLSERGNFWPTTRNPGQCMFKHPLGHYDWADAYDHLYGDTEFRSCEKREPLLLVFAFEFQ